MAVAMLLENRSKAMQELFSVRLDATGITEMKDLAFILGGKSDAGKVAEEVFGIDNNPEVQLVLVQLWEAAKGPGRSILALEAKQSVAPISVIDDAPPPLAPMLPLKVKVDSGT